MLVGGLVASWHWEVGRVTLWSPLLHRTMRWRKPGPQLGVHSDQSRATHSGGHVWLLQGSNIFGRGWVQEASSRVFSSLAEIFLLQKTLRVRTPSLQLRLHSDQFPMVQAGGQGSVLQGLCRSGTLVSVLQKWLGTVEPSESFLHTTDWIWLPAQGEEGRGKGRRRLRLEQGQAVGAGPTALLPWGDVTQQPLLPAHRA